MEGGTMQKKTSNTITILVSALLLLGLLIVARPPRPSECRHEAKTIRATLHRMNKGAGFRLIPMSDPDAYALQELDGRNVVVLDGPAW